MEYGLNTTSEHDPYHLVGTLLDDRYEISAIVTFGGFSVVYKARQIVFRETVAIKICLCPPNIDSEQKEQYFEAIRLEAQYLHNLSKQDPVFVRVLDTGVLASRVPYVVLEWLDGRTLASELEAQRRMPAVPTSLTTIVSRLERIATGLQHAHEMNIVHRDIKPSNIFVTASGLRLIDFNTSKTMIPMATSAPTAIGFAGFTAEYAAPEQYNSARYGHTGSWTDVYSMALLLVEMLTNQRALRGHNRSELMHATESADDRPTPRNRGANVSDEVEKVFAKALALSTKDRYKSIGDFWQALKTAMGQVASDEHQTSIKTTPANPSDLEEVRANSALDNGQFPAQTVPWTTPEADISSDQELNTDKSKADPQNKSPSLYLQDLNSSARNAGAQKRSSSRGPWIIGMVGILIIAGGTALGHFTGIIKVSTASPYIEVEPLGTISASSVAPLASNAGVLSASSMPPTPKNPGVSIGIASAPSLSPVASSVGSPHASSPLTPIEHVCPNEPYPMIEVSLFRRAGVIDDISIRKFCIHKDAVPIDVLKNDSVKAMIKLSENIGVFTDYGNYEAITSCNFFQKSTDKPNRPLNCLTYGEASSICRSLDPAYELPTQAHYNAAFQVKAISATKQSEWTSQKVNDTNAYRYYLHDDPIQREHSHNQFPITYRASYLNFRCVTHPQPKSSSPP